MDETWEFESDVDSVRPIASLALFYIAFLVAEYLFDGRAAEFVSAGAVAVTESAVVAASVVGFALYALARARLAEGCRALLHAAGALSAIGVIVVSFAPGAASLYASGVLTMLLLGFSGAAAHEALARRFADGPGIARVVGDAYGAAIVAQCVLQAVSPGPVVLAGFLLVPAAVAPVLAGQCLEAEAAGADVSNGRMPAGELRRRVALLAALIALMTCVFSTLNVTLTNVHATGAIDLGSWMRLLLAVSAVAGGEAFDRLDHRFEPGLMACVTTLSSFAVFALLAGAPAMLATVVFYLGSGFFVVFFTSSFMLVARETGRYALWSGMGRVVNLACSLVVAAPALALVDGSRVLAESAVILAVLAAMLAVTFLMILGPRPEPALPSEDAAASLALSLSADERLAAFAHEFGLTNREAEVLEAMVTSRQSIQELVRELGLSRTAFYRHVSNMNQKTGTKNRVELMHFYFDWEPGTFDQA